MSRRAHGGPVRSIEQLQLPQKLLLHGEYERGYFIKRSGPQLLPINALHLKTLRDIQPVISPGLRIHCLNQKCASRWHSMINREPERTASGQVWR